MTPPVAPPSGWRSVLFVPGDRPDRFAKAVASGADAVCLDLEDAVLPAAKAIARREILSFLDTWTDTGAVALIVRTNAVGSVEGVEDLKALGALSRPPLLMLPKVERSGTISDAVATVANPALPGIIALIESARGLRHAPDIAAASGVIALALGIVDLAAELGAVFDPTAMASLRLMLRLAAAEGGVAVLDGPSPDIKDAVALGRSAGDAAALGFDGKLAIHPAQIEAIHTAFTPPAEEVATAERLIAAAQGMQGAFQFEGRMIDAPVILAAQRRLLRARR